MISSNKFKVMVIFPISGECEYVFFLEDGSIIIWRKTAASLHLGTLRYRTSAAQFPSSCNSIVFIFFSVVFCDLPFTL